MDKLHPTYVKIVPAGGNLATATPKVLADEEATAKLQGVRTLPNYDIEFGVYRPSDGLLCLYQYYDMNVIPSAEFSFKQGERYYLALTAKSTSISEYTIDNSAGLLHGS